MRAVQVSVKLFKVRAEGELIEYGFNFYPWSTRKYSIGFILRFAKDWQWRLRYAPHVKKFYCRIETR